MSKIVKALFRCSTKSVSKWSKQSSEYCSIKFEPVYDDGSKDPEIKSFSEATPSGSLELGCVKKDIAECFDPGELYYLSIEKRPSPAQPVIAAPHVEGVKIEEPIA
jgi:hypothetical protein